MLSAKYFAKTSCIFLQLFIGKAWENTGKEGINLISFRTEVHTGERLNGKRRCVVATVGKSCALFTSGIE